MTEKVPPRLIAASVQTLLEELVPHHVSMPEGRAAAADSSVDLIFHEGTPAVSVCEAVAAIVAAADAANKQIARAEFVPIAADGFGLAVIQPATDAPALAGGALLGDVAARLNPSGARTGLASIAGGPSGLAMLVHAGACRSLLVTHQDGATGAVHAADTDVMVAALRDLAGKCSARVEDVIEAAWALVLARCCGQDFACYARPGPEPDARPGIRRLSLADCRFLSDLVAAAAREEAQALAAPAGLGNWAELAVAEPAFDSLIDAGALARTDHPEPMPTAELPLVLVVSGADRISLRMVQFGGNAADPASPLTGASFAAAAAMLGYLARLLGAMASADPETPLASLDMLSASEREQLLALAQPDLPLAKAPPCPVSRFEERAAAQPEATAVISEEDGVTLSYAALDARANALAARLMQAGFGPEQICAINLPRGADFVVAMLAALKCGGAFLPLDMSLPETERSLRAAETGIAAVIGREGLGGLAAPVLAPDGLERAAPPPRPGPDATQLAYVIHTSGSTGRPKGVMGTTGALSAHASAVITAYGLQATDRVMQFASPGFDVALEETFPTLLAGGTLVIRSEDQAGSLNAFLALLRNRGLTVLNLPASFWHVLVEEMAHRALALPASVRLIITGSERIQPSALAEWQKLAPACGWINGYGPTETTITATAHAPDLTAGPVDASRDVPIGRPMPHALAYVLAFDRSLAPRGAEGSLHIGGPAVTRGYLNQPESTAAAFGADPFAPQGGRIYNTGDRARWRPDGALDFLGRRDRQVKLRGQRIDLGEIERTLAQFESVREARVAVDGAGTDAARLIAWVNGPDLADGSPTLLRLVEKVARHMSGATMPVILPVAAFPLKPNGKVDMAALPRPGARSAQGGAETGPPDALTGAVAACVAEVLARPSVDPDVDIRDLGANSLVALRLASVLESRFGRPVVTTDLYRNPTPRTIARFLEVESDAPRFVVPIQTEGSQPPFFAVHVLGDKEMLYRPLAAALGPDFPVYGLTVGPPKKLDDIVVEQIARQYFDDVQRAFPDGPITLGAVSMAAYFAYELAQQLIAAGRDVRVLAVLDAEGPDGRPPVHGLAKIAAHLRQLGRHGFGHLTKIARFKLENRRTAQELAESAPGEVTGANLVMANIRAVAAYDPQPFSRPIAVFRAGDSFWDSPEALRSCLGWASVAKGGLTMVDVPGDHLSILDPQNVDHLARHLAVMIRGKA